MKAQYIANGVLALMLIIGAFSWTVGVTPLFTPATAVLSTQEPIRVGALLCLTGICADFGENSLDGLLLAEAEINAGGGVLGRRIKVVVEDSAEENPSRAIAGYQKLRASGVELIVGPSYTAAALALVPIVTSDNVVITTPSAGVAWNEMGKHMFKTWPQDYLATQALARHAFEQGVRRIAVVSAKDAWYQEQSDTFTKEFTALGGTVLLTEYVQLTDTDLRTHAIKVASLKPDSVMYANFDNMGFLAKELKQLGFAGKQFAIFMDPVRIEHAAGALNGTSFVQYDKPTQAFVSSYFEKYAKDPGLTADTAYDALMLYALAIERAGSAKAADVESKLLKLETYDGVSGNLTFDGKGSITKDPRFWVVRDSKMELFK